MAFQPSSSKRILHFCKRSTLIGCKTKIKSVNQHSTISDIAIPSPCSLESVTTESQIVASCTSVIISNVPAMTLIPSSYYDTSFVNMTTPIYSPVKTIYPQPTFVYSPNITVHVPPNPLFYSFPPVPMYSVVTQHVVIPTTPVLSPMVAHDFIPNFLPSIYDSPPSLYQSFDSIYHDFSTPPTISSSAVDYYADSFLDTTPSQSQDQSFTGLIVTEPKTNQEDPLAFYFELPPNLFYVPRSLSAFDPNYFIDAFCELDNNAQDLAWVLDLEFGHPRKWTQRPLATYDVHTCNIICIDSSMTHPGFSRCSEKLQRLLLFFYDSIISSWYIGFTKYYGDSSVKKFQDWLRTVMDVYGLCWRLRWER